MPSFPKPERRQTTKQRKDRQQAAWIRLVHTLVFERDSTCRICLGSRNAHRDRDEMHEDPSRAKTRNLPPELRFNRAICGRICASCHRALHDGKIRLVFLDPALGFDGPVRGEPIL